MQCFRRFYWLCCDEFLWVCWLDWLNWSYPDVVRLFEVFQHCGNTNALVFQPKPDISMFCTCWISCGFVSIRLIDINCMIVNIKFYSCSYWSIIYIYILKSSCGSSALITATRRSGEHRALKSIQINKLEDVRRTAAWCGCYWERWLFTQETGAWTLQGWAWDCETIKPPVRQAKNKQQPMVVLFFLRGPWIK